MTSTSLIHTDVPKESRIDEYKSPNGIVFRAKLIGNVEVEELRGKTVAENAMAKLKFNLCKKRQHKTKININIKWDGFYVYLTEGGQELLHNFQLEQISFVWKDPTDDRAFGIIITEISSDKQNPTPKFYAYKTEKPAIPLIMTLKELFIFRTKDECETTGDDQQQKPESEIEIVKTAQDLLDLNFSSNKSHLIEEFANEQPVKNCTSNWSPFSNSQSNLTPTIPLVMQIPTMMNNQSPWLSYPEVSKMIQSPFNMSWPTYSCVEANASNPFMSRMEPPMQNITTCQSYPLHSNNKITNTMANHQTTNLFSDLIPSDYGLNSLAKASSNNNESETKKISLVDMKNTQMQKDLKIDFGILDNANNGSVMKENISSNTFKGPLFQID